MRILLMAALAFGVPASLAPTPANADATVQLPQRSVASVRIIGRWLHGNGIVYTIEHDGLRAKGRASRRDTGEVLATFELSPHPVEGVRGPFHDRVNGQSGILSAYHNGQGPVIYVREGSYLGRKAPTGFPLLPLDAAKVASPWVGQWKTTRGLLDIKPEQSIVAGQIQSEHIPSFVALIPEGNQATGGWEGNGSGDVELRLAADGRSFRGWYTDLSTGRASRIEWTGERVGPASPSVGADVPISPALLARYQGDWKMQDSIVRIRPEGSGAVLLVIGQSSGRTLYSMPLVGSAEGNSLEGTDTGLLSGDRLRFRVTLQPGGTDIEARDARYAGDAGQLFWIARRVVAPPPTSGDPVPSTPAPPSSPGPSPADPVPVGAFKPLGQFDVRLDRLWEARGYSTRQVHAFVTIKNVSARPQYITSGFLKAVLSDADGVAQERNQVWRASAEPAALFNSTPVVQPGAELKIRYVFNPDAGAVPERFTLSEGDRRAEFQAAAR